MPYIKPSTTKKRHGGYVYAIGIEGSPLIKIGWAKTVQKRLEILQTGQPVQLSLLASVYVEENVYRIEKRIHGFLAEERRGGEWFEIEMNTARLEALIAQAIAYLLEEERCYQEIINAKVLQKNKALGDKDFIGKRIERLRAKRGMSLSVLAREAGVSKSLVSQLENGVRDGERTAVGIMRKIARALGVGLDYLTETYEDLEEGRPAAMVLV